MMLSDGKPELQRDEIMNHHVPLILLWKCDSDLGRLMESKVKQ